MRRTPNYQRLSEESFSFLTRLYEHVPVWAYGSPVYYVNKDFPFHYLDLINEGMGDIVLFNSGIHLYNKMFYIFTSNRLNETRCNIVCESRNFIKIVPVTRLEMDEKPIYNISDRNLLQKVKNKGRNFKNLLYSKRNWRQEKGGKKSYGFSLCQENNVMLDFLACGAKSNCVTKTHSQGLVAINVYI